MLPEQPRTIVPLIIYTIKDYLDTALTEEVPEDDPTRAVLVKVGRLQESPLKKNVSVAVAGGDFEDPGYLDGRIDNSAFDNLQIPDLWASEIGGGVYWWRRGTINMRVFFVRQRFDEERALHYAYEFYGRLLDALSKCPIHGLIDDYGEVSHAPIYVEGNSFFESGGSDQYIWRGKLLWRVLTRRP